MDFWNRNKPEAEHFHARYGDGSVRGLLSIDISDWESVAPRIGKTAGQCRSGDEVLTEVWEQLKAALNHGEPILADEDVVVRYLDAGIRFAEHGTENDSPLLVHPPGSWYNRPQAVLPGIENLFLAADYVRTTTDLATMESACEAARRAVNGLCERVGRAPSAKLFPMIEDAGRLVRWAKERDRKSWVRGAPPAAAAHDLGRPPRRGPADPGGRAPVPGGDREGPVGDGSAGRRDLIAISGALIASRPLDASRRGRSSIEDTGGGHPRRMAQGARGP